MMDKKKWKERQEKHFEHHEAKFTDYGNIKILDFQKPGTSEYRIRFLFEEDYYRLHISGDLGELIAVNCTNMSYEKFGDFIHNPGYFEEKVRCHNRAFYRYDEDEVKEDLLKLIAEYDLMESIMEEYDEDDENKAIDYFISDITEDLSDNGIGNRGEEVLNKFISDVWEVIPRIGKRSTHIVDLYLLAFELAQKNLNSKKP